MQDASFALLKERCLVCRALQKVLHSEEKLPPRKYMEYQIELLDQLGWKHLQRVYKSILHDKYPPSYRLF